MRALRKARLPQSALDRAPHQAFEVPRAVEGLDVAEAAHGAVVDEDVRHRLPVGAVRELLERDAPPVASTTSKW